jgi:beta-glucanase (GH16 family)
VLLTHQNHHLHWDSHHLMHWHSHRHLPWYMHIHHGSHEPQPAGTYVGRVGTLAVTLGIGTAVAGGFCAACAAADTGASTAADDTSTSQSVNAGPRTTRVTATSIGSGAQSTTQGAVRGADIHLKLPSDEMAPAPPAQSSTVRGNESPSLTIASPAAAATPRAATAVGAGASLSDTIAVRQESDSAATPPAAPGRRALHGTPVTLSSASSPSAATTTTSVTTAVEAERMGLSGPGRIVSDRTASSGSALAITGTSTVSATINVPTATTGLVIRAKASTGAPNLTLAIDGVAVTTLMVPNTGWADLTFAGVVPAGSHKISVASTTATSTYTLYLDKISTMKGPIVDEFTGKSGSAPRDALWGVRSGSGFDSGIASYAANNVFLDGQSHLVIQAVRGKNGTYSSGWVWSKNDVSYGYGTITARIKMPKGQGIWPAFWLVGADSDTVGWPACGEIDVVELPSTTTTMYSTVHGPIAGTTSTQQAQIISTLPDLSTDYHNYWVRHLPDEITFGIDNQTLGTMTPASLQPGETWVYNRPTYIMLNVAVGGPWAGSPDNTTIFPAKMLVDSVRWDPPA